MTTVNKILASVNSHATAVYHNSEVTLTKPIELIGLYETEHDAYRLSDPDSGFYTIINKSDRDRLAKAELGEVNGVQYVIVKVEPMLSARDIKSRKPLI